MLQSTRNPLRRLLVKVARAQALVFIAPVYFVGFPAILKGWIERVFSLGFAFGMTPEAWRVEHAYFHAVHGADDATRAAWLERANRLGREF